MADKDEVDSTEESSASAVDPTSASGSGSHAIEPAVDGVPPDADEPTFRDRERMAAEGDEPDGIDLADDETDEPDEIVDGSGPADTDEPGDDDDDRQLVAVGASSRRQEAGAVEKPAAPRGRQKKDKATPRQKQAVDKERRTGPVKFVKESISELQKVVYPTGNQLVNYFVVVLIFVLFIIAIVSLLDLAFGKAIIAIFS